jgi:hypothetical protein
LGSHVLQAYWHEELETSSTGYLEVEDEGGKRADSQSASPWTQSRTFCNGSTVFSVVSLTLPLTLKVRNGKCVKEEVGQGQSEYTCIILQHPTTKMLKIELLNKCLCVLS